MSAHPLFQQNKPLSVLSTFGVGGPAEYFLEVHTIEKMQEALLYCHEHHLPFLILGKGSNCLFDDRGVAGAVLLNKIAFADFTWPFAHVGAGYSFSLLGVQTARNGFSGLEFASGIPGSVGGAVFMNAGANGGETKDALVEVTFVNAQGGLEVFAKEQMTFNYRTSSFQDKKGAIVSAKFLLTPSSTARQHQLGIVEYRTKTQPYGEKSAGCVFRNPDGASAGALIDQCGLKGTQIGGAAVSPLHANFLLNTAQATASDILELAAHVREVVKEQTGHTLEMEIRRVPYDLSC